MFLFFSCSSPQSESIDTDLVKGTWQLEQVTFNDLDGYQINEWISNSTILNIDDNFFYRNYIVGTWSIDRDRLILKPDSALSDFLWDYEILELSANLLELQIILSEGQYCCDFDEFDSDELITITETYMRVEDY